MKASNKVDSVESTFDKINKNSNSSRENTGIRYGSIDRGKVSSRFQNNEDFSKDDARESGRIGERNYKIMKSNSVMTKNKNKNQLWRVTGKFLSVKLTEST